MLKSFVEPGRLILIVWVGCLVAYTCSFGEFPTDRVVTWVAVLASGFCLGANVQLGSIRVHIFSDARVLFVRNICLLLFVVQLFYLSETAVLVIDNGLLNHLVAVRAAALAGEPLVEHYALYLQVNTLLLTLALFGLSRILLNNDGVTYKKHLYLLYVFALLVSVVDGSRSVFIVGVFSLLALSLAVGRLSTRKLFSSVLIALVAFTATASLFRPDTPDTGILEQIRSAFVYLCGSLGTMDPVLADRIAIHWFDPESISNKLNALGLPFPVYDLSELQNDYVELPFDLHSNVFSAFGLYYSYFGVVGSIELVTVLGWVCGAIYRGSNHSAFMLTVYALLWPAIVLTPFHDYFVQQGYTILKVLFVLVSMRIVWMFVGVLRSFAKNMRRAVE